MTFRHQGNPIGQVGPHADVRSFRGREHSSFFRDGCSTRQRLQPASLTTGQLFPWHPLALDTLKERARLESERFFAHIGEGKGKGRGESMYTHSRTLVGAEKGSLITPTAARPHLL